MHIFLGGFPLELEQIFILLETAKIKRNAVINHIAEFLLKLPFR